MNMPARISVVVSSVIIVAAACGGRSGIGPDDIGSSTGGAGGIGADANDVDVVDDDVGVGEEVDAPETPVEDENPDVEAETSVDVTVDEPPDEKDVAVDEADADASPGTVCFSCITEKCDDVIIKCLDDEACIGGIPCYLNNCMDGSGSGGDGGAGGGGGGVDIPCATECFGGLGSALVAIQALGCVVGTCGGACGYLADTGGGGPASSFGFDGPTNGFGVPFGLFGNSSRNRYYGNTSYIGSVRVPQPWELHGAYPELANALAGRAPAQRPEGDRKGRPDGR